MRIFILIVDASWEQDLEVSHIVCFSLHFHLNQTLYESSSDDDEEEVEEEENVNGSSKVKSTDGIVDLEDMGRVVQKMKVSLSEMNIYYFPPLQKEACPYTYGFPLTLQGRFSKVVRGREPQPGSTHTWEREEGSRKHKCQ